MASDWKQTVRSLLVPLQRAENPFDEIDQALKKLGDDPEKRSEIVKDLDIALGHSEPLSFLIQQPHSEDMVRDFLHDVLKALKEAKPIKGVEKQSAPTAARAEHHEKLIIAVDFDGTIVEHRFPEIGQALPGAIETLRELQTKGHRLVLFTCREDQMDETGRLYLTEAIKFCRQKGVTFVSANQNLTQDDFRPTGGRKVHADVYIDDRNLGGFIGWDRIYEMLIGKKRPA